MISLKCPNCGFFFCVGFPDDISDEEKNEIYTCPCGTIMEEVPFNVEYIPTIGGAE